MRASDLCACSLVVLCARSIVDSPFAWRWFELRGGDLSYYAHSHSTERIGVLTLQNAVEVRPVKLNKKVKLDNPMPSEKGRAHNHRKVNVREFGIEIEDRNGAVYGLCCATGDDRENWITALKKAVASLDGNGNDFVVRTLAIARAASLY